jgi:3-hydroxyisobutyrate dehydrogenase-like beta-hydroxyacid dehydrogenase
MAKDQVPVGIIGTGLMGTACARRLLGTGLAVLGFDVDGARLHEFTALGCGAAASVAEIAHTCRKVVLCVFNTTQVEETVEGPGGLLANLRADASPIIVVCTSTCDPDRIAALAARIPANRLHYVEAPVSGTSDQTARGEALGLIGGDPAAAEEARDVLDAICPRWHHLGAAGNGGRAKLAINLILGVTRAAVAEGLVFAERLGLDPGAFLAVARDSAAYSQIMDVKGMKMVKGDWEPHGKITQTLKDFLLMHEQATAHGQKLPLAQTYVDLVRGCVAAGEGEWDNAAVIREIRRRRA